MYAQANGLLDTPGWKRCKNYVKNSKKLARMVNQAHLKSYHQAPVYKYGQQVPRHHNEAMFIDEKNGNNKWHESEE